MAKSDKIQGTVRLGGKSFVEGDEDALNELADEMGVDVSRAYGVDSTERGKTGRKRETGPEARAKALANKAQREADRGVANADEILATPVDGLADALSGVSDMGSLRKLARRDKRTTAKQYYDARIAELKAEKEAAEGTDEESES